MNTATTKHGPSLVLGLVICLALINVSQAKIILARYITTNDLVGNFQIRCTDCNAFRFVNQVYDDDKNVTPFLYTYCNTNPPTYSLNVGMSIRQDTFIRPNDCLVAGTQFVAFDSSESTLAAQFYFDCKQARIYKCRGNMVFDQPTGRCVPGSYLTPRVVVNPFATCTDDQIPTPVSSLACETLLNRTVPSVCASCRNPFNAKVLLSDGNDVAPRNIEYTYCADNDRFSFDLFTDSSPHTFFIPDCRGRLVVPIEPSRTTVLSGLYWDCRLGLLSCPPSFVFDSASNRCVNLPGGLANLATNLERCTKTCGVYPPFPAATQYSPASYAPPKPYASPIAGYGYGK